MLPFWEDYNPLGIRTSNPAEPRVAEAVSAKSPVSHWEWWWVGAIVWMFSSLQNSYVEILTLSVMVLGGGVFGRWLGQEVRALMNGIKCPY